MRDRGPFKRRGIVVSPRQCDANAADRRVVYVRTLFGQQRSGHLLGDQSNAYTKQPLAEFAFRRDLIMEENNDDG